MRAGLGLAVALVALVVSCQTTPQPLGEALVVVQTDVAVPRRVNRLRIEIFGADGRIVEARDVPTPMPEDWPLSFSVVLPEGANEASTLVRLRAWPDGHEASAVEIERVERQPARNTKVFGSLAEACAAAPTLRLGKAIVLRRGATPITQLGLAQECSDPTETGSAVARLEITDPGEYRIEIERTVPDGATAEPGSDTALSLRRDCIDVATQVACVEDLPGSSRLSRLDRVKLDPGVYWVVTGGSGDPAPADMTLRASRVDAFISVPDDEPLPSTADPLALDPMPGVTIDRLVAVDLRAGERGRVDVTLHGECFGTPAIVADRSSCIDKADARAKIEPVRPNGDLDVVPPAPPSWVGDAKVPCSSDARPNEVCVPGGAFILGDLLALEDLALRSQPERVRVVEPFFLDKYEMSVGRFREALTKGFVPAGGMPLVNDRPALDENAPLGMCTFSTTDVGRERHPLNCVSWATAHSLCQFLEGELPTEEQWEYAATAAGKDAETSYPWGDALPTCGTTVYARTSFPSAQCLGAPVGPLPVDDPLLVSGDVSPLGIVGLAGNLSELLVTPFVPYSDPVWRDAGLRRPVEENDAPLRMTRGTDWAFDLVYATASTRRAEPATARFTNLGFRCARKGR